MYYTPSDIENKWQKIWEEKEVFKFNASERTQKKFYQLEMFPYPSGRIHMGHVRNYSIGDVTARYYFRKGYNVLHPIGWDSFGLPAENAAIEHKTAPAKWTYANIENMKSQLKKLGFAYDWSRETATCTKEYYRWEQLFFIEMWEKGLVYKKNSEVNWCNKCNTVLANEQVEDGFCWRCGSEVEKRKIEQWFFKITDYAEELLTDLDTLEGWPENVKEMQRNWIGRSEGTYIDFKVKGSDEKLKVFTTRPDTFMGITFASMAVEHPWSDKIVHEAPNRKEMEEFIDEVKKLHATVKDDNYEKKGFFTGKYLIHPETGAEIPLYFANFVLADYGTGAVMAVPAHDQRDFDFAEKYEIPVKIVIRPEDKELELPLTEAYTEPGVMVNSGEFDGMKSTDAKKAISDHLIEKGCGERGINFRLRDWGISRQRYWGTPIPMVKCEKCGVVPVKKSELPVVLPENVMFSGATSPLNDMPEFYETTCPVCGGKARRETDTMDTFVESSWYHMRYVSPHSDNAPFISEDVNYAMPIDQYIGGIEHAVMHLLYTRFFTKVLADLGYINFREPAKRLLTQGMVCMESYRTESGEYVYPEDVENRDGILYDKNSGEKITVGRKEKMSKSKKNVVDPDDMIARYGADTCRIFSLFAAPPEKDLEWSEEGIEGSFRFLFRVWNIVTDNLDLIEKHNNVPETVTEGKELFRKTHEVIKKVSEDIERFHFNTAISAIMELVNSCYKFNADTIEKKELFAFALRTAVSLLNPFAPHMTEELFKMTGNEKLLSKDIFPTYKEDALVAEEITVVVQINGKLRDKLTVSPDASREEIETLVKENSEKYVKFLKSGEIKKIIYVPGKLVNVVG